MSGRRAANRIRGPQSALTDFLAANNISAQQIRDSYAQRMQAAADAAGEDGTEDPEAAEAAAAAEAEAAAAEAAEAEAAIERTKKRKRTSDNAAAKVKAKKAAAKKKGKKGSDDEDDDGDYDYALDTMYKKPKLMPGQRAKCEVCEKAFTVTPYSKSGPENGLLCTPCGKELVKDEKKQAKANKPKGTKMRRKVESNRLDGLVTSGAKSLQTLCIETAAKVADDVDELGDLPEPIMNRLSQIFSKSRKLDSRTMKLFLKSGMDTVAFWDCAALETEDYDLVFAIVPHVKKVILRNASQFKDCNLDYMMEKAAKLEFLHLHCANLVSNGMWIKYFQERGKNLKAIKLQWLDASFDDDAVRALVENCANVERLKFELCRQISPEGFELLNKLNNLEHLSLQLSATILGERLVNLIGNVGANLRTLSLDGFIEADDSFLDAIHTTCTNLQKFRFCANDYCTDAGYAALFTNWANPPLHFADLHANRDIDSSNPVGPEDPVGLATAGFTALMEHSGSRLERLDVSSCRHIPLVAWLDIFNGVKQYPRLTEIDISFCATPDTTVVAGMFKSCPKLKKLAAFGCFAIEDVVVPQGIVVVGLPRAQDAIEQYGEGGVDVEGAFGRMIEMVA